MIKSTNSLLEYIKKLSIYGTNGLINTAITYGLFLIISEIIDYRLTIGIVYTIGIFISYFLNGKFVFNTKGNLGIFIVIMVLMFITNLSITWILVESFNVSKEIAQLIAIIVVFGVGFQLNKQFSFRKKNN